MDYKFNEDKLITQFKEYIDATYDSHYSQNGFQSTEIIIERGHGTGFCMGNIDKYSNRYGKKGNKTEQRKDLVKIMHYALIQLHIHDNSRINSNLKCYSFKHLIRINICIVTYKERNYYGRTYKSQSMGRWSS